MAQFQRRTVTLANTICVVFVTHGYETAFLIQERSEDHLMVERTRRARACGAGEVCQRRRTFD